MFAGEWCGFGIRLTEARRAPDNEWPIDHLSEGELPVLIRLFGFKGTLKIAAVFVAGAMLYGCVKS